MTIGLRIKTFLKSLYITVFFTIGLFLACRTTLPEYRVVNLQCLDMQNPQGIDAMHPLLSWQVETTQNKNYHQKQYRIRVATDRDKLLGGTADIWDSGVIDSDQSTAVEYAGPQLTSRMTYFWQVEVWNEKGEMAKSGVASWEMGLVSPSDWEAQWIMHSQDSTEKAAPLFRREFKLTQTVRSARVYISGLGYYELHLNGHKIGDRYLDPAFTDYEDRALYATYDVTEMLQSGENAMGVILGNGWYNVQTLAVWDFERAPWRHSPVVLVQLELNYEDGTSEKILSDTSWKTATGPLVFNSIYSGEIYNAQLEKTGWNQPGYDDRQWIAAEDAGKVIPKLEAQSLPPIRVAETFNPVRITHPKAGVYVADFGQNIAGITRLHISGQAGDTVSIRHGEVLNPDGTVDQHDIEIFVKRRDSTQDFQRSIYILKGEGEETYEPRFTYYGFQYAEITVPEGYEIKPENIEALFLHTDVEPAGSFHASDSLLNRIHRSTQYSYLSNLYGYFTDCPQREKNGWTGDANIASDLGLYNYHGINVYKKWLRDLADGQKPSGEIPVIAPTGGWGYWQEPVWDGALTNIPMNLYLYEGDQEMIRTLYDQMKRHFSYWEEKAPEQIVNAGLGDWLSYETQTPRELTSTAYFYHESLLLSRFAALLQRPEDEDFYQKKADTIKAAFNATFFKSDSCTYANGSQTALSCALYFGLVPAEQQACVADHLARLIRANDTRLDVGLLGSKFVLGALSENGYIDLAYELAASDKLPSWGYWVKQGFTTLLENWDPESPQDISVNHIMLGAVDEWFFHYLGGIQPDPQAPGFQHFLLKPYFAPQLEYLEVSHQSPYGRIISNWKRSDRVISWEITIPANSSATIGLPPGEVTVDGKGPDKVSGAGNERYLDLGSGTYLVEVK